MFPNQRKGRGRPPERPGPPPCARSRNRFSFSHVAAPLRSSSSKVPEPAGSEASLARLADLAPGEAGVVVGVQGEDAIGRRLLDLGLLPGTAISVVRRAPLGDPVLYELRGYRLCLRRGEAARVTVRRQPGPGA